MFPAREACVLASGSSRVSLRGLIAEGKGGGFFVLRRLARCDTEDA